MRHNIPLIFNPSVVANVLLFVVYLSTWLGIKTEPTNFKIGFFIVLTCTMLVATIGHGIGGMSWFYI